MKISPQYKNQLQKLQSHQKRDPFNLSISTNI